MPAFLHRKSGGFANVLKPRCFMNNFAPFQASTFHTRAGPPGKGLRDGTQIYDPGFPPPQHPTKHGEHLYRAPLFSATKAVIGGRQWLKKASAI